MTTTAAISPTIRPVLELLLPEDEDVEDEALVAGAADPEVLVEVPVEGEAEVTSPTGSIRR